MGEKLTKGIIGGIVAGIVKDIPNAVFHNVLKLTNLSLWDYSAQIAFFRHPQGLGEQIYALTYEIIFSIIIAVTYVYLKDSLKTNHYLLFGVVFGAGVWFTIHALILAFQIQPLMNTHFMTSVINSLCSILYGIILAWIVHYLEKPRKQPDRNKNR